MPPNPQLREITTPLQLQAWQVMLQGHPDKVFVQYILNGIEFGFRIGYTWGSQLKAAKKNMTSAKEHPDIVSSYLAEECKQGRVLEPLSTRRAPECPHNRFWVIPKQHQPNCWRLIVDLSYPDGASVNDGISKELCSLQYIKIDQVAEVVAQHGQGAELGKIDIKNAYRVVHLSDHPLLGMRWEGKEYVDSALLFGLRSAPKIFNAIADALDWILQSKKVKCITHYLDDFVTIGAPKSGECASNMETMAQVCQQLGMPFAPEKIEGPLTCMT